MGGDQRHHVRTRHSQLSESFRVGDDGVIGEAPGGFEQFSHLAADGSHVLLSATAAVLGQLQAAIKREGRLAFAWVEVAVSAAEGQTVRLANRRAGADFDGKIEVSTHFTHEKLLLKVLAAEVRRVRLNDVEQLQHDCRHAAEVPGPQAPSQTSRQGLDVDERAKIPPG